MTRSDDVEELRRALRARLRAGEDDVALAASELRALLDELGRLQQSNDRLRRQNRRVRLRLQRLGADDEESDGDGDGDGGAGPGSGGAVEDAP
jgi:chromosome segregation ATPase